MSRSQVQELYLFKSVPEIHAKSVVPKSKKITPKQLLESCKKLDVEATSCFDTGDEEKSYLYFMKLMNAWRIIQSSPEYKSDSKYFKNMIGPQRLKNAVDKMEKLDESLRERYAQKEDEEAKIEKAKAFTLTHEEEENQNKKNSSVREKRTQIIETNLNLNTMTITPNKLHSLFEEKSTSFLIIDIRPQKHFEDSHILHSSLLSVPEEMISPGMTASKLYGLLSDESQSLWQKRLSVDLLILTDWSSSSLDGDNTKLKYIYDAMKKWDPIHEYKCKFSILDGGYENFVLHYPMKVLNPKLGKNPYNKKEKNNQFPTLDFNYPDLSNGFPPSPTLKPNINNLAINSGAIKTTRDSSNFVPPSFDRTQKPNLAMKENLPSCSGSLNKQNEMEKNIITQMNNINLDTTNVEKKETKSKPNFFNNQGESSDQFILSKGLPYVNSIDSKVSENDPDKEADLMPKVDRTSKAKALISMERGNVTKRDLIDAKKELAEEGTSINQDRLNLELDWERLKIKKENEANKEMHEEMLKREDELIAKLQDAEKDIEKKEKENIELRNKIESIYSEVKAKETQSTNLLSDKEAERNVELQIRIADRQKAEMAKKADEMRRIRKEKESAKRREKLILENRNDRSRVKPEERNSSSTYKAPLNDTPGETKSNLRRSHSSPNIAQLMDKDDIKARNMMPSFDRTIKPSRDVKVVIPPIRNFEGAWGNVKRGVTGLRNLGNTCFMNSIIQCVSNITPLSTYFIEGTYRQDVNRKSKGSKGGEVALEFAEVVRALWNGQYKYIATSDFKRVIGFNNRLYAGRDQQDAHEFCIHLMDWLHMDLNSVHREKSIPEQENTKLRNIEAAELAWRHFKLNNESIIISLFYGERKSTVKCLVCHHESTKYEPFFNLSVPLPSGNSRHSLRQCIDKYLMGERVTSYKCENCGEKRDALKKMDIWKLPPILIIHLERFYNDGLWRKKQNYVDFELKNFDLRHTLISPPEVSRFSKYNLSGVSNHFGTMEGGHYTAYCHSSIYKQWFKFDDQEVYEMGAGDVRSSAAYLLFYSSIDTGVPT